MRRIRSSMLPAASDCRRRAVAKQFPELLGGYETRGILRPAGSLVGTAVHKMGADFSRALQRGERPSIESVEDAAVEALKTEVAKGVEWDQTTPRLDTAISQAKRLFNSYAPLLSTRKPALVEAEMLCELAPNWELSGTVDLLTVDGRIDDLKTGAKLSPYISQVGAYAVLVSAHIKSGAIAGVAAVNAVSTTFVKRVSEKAAQPAPLVQEYDVVASQRLAMSTIRSIIREVEAFEATGDPNVFNTNPMSLTCSKRFCPVWGTEFCKAHLPASEE